MSTPNKSKIKVTLLRSPIGRPQKQKDTVKALGLRRLHQSVVHANTPQLRGMIAKVAHLIDIEILSGAQEAGA